MSFEKGAGTDRLGVAVGLSASDGGRGTTHWHVRKWDADQTQWVARHTGLLTPQGRDFTDLGVTPYEVSESHGNVITNAGWQAILALATTGAGTVYSATKGRIGVGNGSTSPTATSTDLSAAAGSTNRWFQLCGAAPTVGSGTNRTWTFVATFASADGNFVWSEFGIDSGTASGNTVTAALINVALSSQGTKTSGQTWTATAVLSFT